MIIFSLAPAALWSGAITPVLDERNVTQTIQTLSYANSKDALFSGSANMSSSIAGGGYWGAWSTPDGLFSFDPATTRNVILNSAVDASSVASGGLHAKLDKTGLKYKGRSFGAAAGAGITEKEVGTNNRNWYSYSAPGFRSTATCRYNESSTFNLIGCSTNDVGDSLCFAGGSLQDGSTPVPDPLNPVYWGYSMHDLFAWGLKYDNETKKFLISMTAGAVAGSTDSDPWSFSSLNQTQCTLDVTPKLFDVVVNSTNKIVQVTEQEDQVEWPDYGDSVMDMISTWLWHFTVVDGQGGGSQLGHALRLNINALQQNSPGTQNNLTQITMQGIQDSLVSIFDDISIQLLATRYAGNSTAPTKDVQATVALVAIRLGSLKYVTAVVVVNSLITVVYIIESIRTRVWSGISSFDITDVKGVILSTLKGASDETTIDHCCWSSSLHPALSSKLSPCLR